MYNNLLPIMREAFKPLSIAVAGFLVASILGSEILEFLFFISFVLIVYMYRNPERLTPSFQEASIVSPVDGVINALEEIEDAEYGYMLEIQSGYFDVGVLRFPFTGRVLSSDLQRGARLSSRFSLSAKLNENTTLIFEDKESNRLKLVHTLKQSFEDLHIDLDASAEITQGRRYGFMLYGVTKIYLPRNFRMGLKIGDEVRASDSLLGYFTQK